MKKQILNLDVKKVHDPSSIGLRRKYPALQGQETHLQTLIEQSYQQYYARHADKVSDERSQTHLQVRCWIWQPAFAALLLLSIQHAGGMQVACLTLATYKTLLPWIKNHQVQSTIHSCVCFMHDSDMVDCADQSSFKLVHMQELAEIIRAHMGEQISPALR